MFLRNKKMNQKIKLLTAATLMFSINVLAAATPATSSSTATPESVKAPAKSKISVGYFGQVNTTSIGSPSKNTPGNWTAKSDDTINLYSSLGVGYKLTDELTVKVANRFEYRPATGSGSDFKLLNHRLFAEKANLINRGGFNLKGSAGLEFPSEKKARETNHMFLTLD
jgi:putative salt-induced outer membrane protein YdiY